MLSGLTGIVLDPANQILFYTRGVSYGNCPFGEVSSVNMDGSSPTVLDIDSWHPDGIDLSGGTVYWANPGINLGSASGPLNTMDTAGGNKNIAQLPHISGHGRSVAVDAANNLLFYSAHTASIFGLGAPRTTGGEIFVVDLNNVGAGATNVLSDPTTGIPDVELDAANMRIYWTDYANGQINSASYDAAGNLSPITIEVSGLTNPYGLALEPEIEIEKTLVSGPNLIGISLPGPTAYQYTIVYTGPAALVKDTVPAEFDVTSVLASAGSATAEDTSKGKKKQQSATRIEWNVPAGTSTLTVDIETVQSPGKGHKLTVFKPTSCGPLPINDGATAFEVDADGNLVLVEVTDPATGVVTLEPVVIVGPSNSLEVEAVDGAKLCVEIEDD